FTSATSVVGPTPRSKRPAVSASESLLLLSLQKTAQVAVSRSSKFGNSVSTAPHSGPSSGNTSCLKSSAHGATNSSVSALVNKFHDELDHSAGRSTFVIK